MNQHTFSVLIPAAGASERLGQAKQLVIYQGNPLIQNAVDAAQSTNPHEIIVVTGADAKAVTDAVQNEQVHWVHNPNWSSGMGGSIALGAAAISRQSSGLMVLLCDQWRIQPQDLRAMLETWQSDPTRIVVAEAQGHYMPPVIFPSVCFSQLQRLEGNQGARSLLKTHPALLTPVSIKNAAFDLDTQTHLDMLKDNPA